MKNIPFLFLFIFASCNCLIHPSGGEFGNSTASSFSGNNCHLLFLGEESDSQLLQIFSMSLLDQTITQITFAPIGVRYFDVSLSSENIVYIDSSRSVIINSPDSGKEVIIFEDVMLDVPPAWSDDGKIVSFDKNGIFLYYVDNNIAYNIITNPSETGRYRHYSFSPNGKYLIISTPLYYIYDILNHNFIRMNDPKDNAYSLEASIYWSSDSRHIYIAENRFLGTQFGIIYPGLWRSTINGDGEYLLRRKENENNVHLQKIIAPWEDVENGYLYYFFSPNSTDEYSSLAPYYLLRTAIDGQTGLIYVYEKPFYLSSSSNIVWDKSGKFMVMIQQNINSSNPNLLLVSTDNTQPILTLMQNASFVKGNLRISGC